jgi:tripartite ATP-independent transporter DctM subunit
LRKRYPVERHRLTGGEILVEMVRGLYVLIMPVFVVGTVVAGIATATESAGLGVLYAAIVGFILTRHLTLAAFYEALRSAILTSAKIMMIIALSQVFIWVLAYERVPENIAATVAALQLSPTIKMLFVAEMILAAGTFIDVSPAILLFTPVFLPTVTEAGVSPILFGVVLVSGLAVGACTPPVGNCLNVCAAISDLPIGSIFRGAAYFLLANVIVLALIILVPQLVLWIPDQIMQ